MSDIPPSDEISAVSEKNVYRPLKPGEALPGGMPIVDDLGDRRRFYQRLEEFYPGERHNGKHSMVITHEGVATKFFFRPESLESAWEVEFMRRFAEKAGLPKFLGTTVNGYLMEEVQGDNLKHLIGEATKDGDMAKVKNLLTREQGQQILDKIVQYHRGTGRLNGDLASLDNIIVGKGGTINLIDTEWERLGDQTPQSELDTVYNFLTEKVGLENLNKPLTISAEESQANLEKFKDEVAQIVVRDPVHRSVAHLTNASKVKISEDGTPLIQG